MLYKTGFVLISPTVAEWQATQNCVTDRHKIFPLTAIPPSSEDGDNKHHFTYRHKIFPLTAIPPSSMEDGDNKHHFTLVFTLFESTKCPFHISMKESIAKVVLHSKTQQLLILIYKFYKISDSFI